MLDQSIYTLGLIANSTETENEAKEKFTIQYTVTLVTAVGNKPKNEDYDPEMPENGAQYLLKAKKRSGKYITWRSVDKAEVNAITKGLQDPNDSFYK
jgi:hypothetical protein